MRRKQVHLGQHVAAVIIGIAILLLVAMSAWPKGKDLLGVPAVVLLILGVVMFITFTGRRA